MMSLKNKGYGIQQHMAISRCFDIHYMDTKIEKGKGLGVCEKFTSKFSKSSQGKNRIRLITVRII